MAVLAFFSAASRLAIASLSFSSSIQLSTTFFTSKDCWGTPSQAHWPTAFFEGVSRAGRSERRSPPPCTVVAGGYRKRFQIGIVAIALQDRLLDDAINETKVDGPWMGPNTLSVDAGTEAASWSQ